MIMFSDVLESIIIALQRAPDDNGTMGNGDTKEIAFLTEDSDSSLRTYYR